jgi:hypothetical protein
MVGPVNENPGMLARARSAFYDGPKLRQRQTRELIYKMWSCRVKLDEENPTYAGLAQENGFIWLHTIVHVGCPDCALAEKSVINRIWLLLSISNWSIIMIDCSRWFAISSSPRASLLSQFQFDRWGLQKRVHKLKLGCEKYFGRVTYWAPLEMLLEHKNQTSSSST